MVEIVEQEKSEDADRKLATALSNLLEVYAAQTRWEEAKPLYERLLTIMEHLRGPEHSDLIPVLEGYAKCLDATRHAKDARAIRKRIERIRKTFVSR